MRRVGANWVGFFISRAGRAGRDRSSTNSSCGVLFSSFLCFDKQYNINLSISPIDYLFFFMKKYFLHFSCEALV